MATVLGFSLPTKVEHIHVAYNGISESGIREIRNWINSQSSPQLAPLPSDWCYDWCVKGKGVYVGTFPKRVAKFQYTKYSTKLTSAQMAELGTLANRHCVKQSDYWIDFTQDFDWEPGDFGEDPESCYWKSKDEARTEILPGLNSWAFRFYEKRDYSNFSGSHYEGMARCWAVPFRRTFVLFNAYGMELTQMARIASSMWDCYYKKLKVENNGESDGLLWINSGSGIAVGNQADVLALGSRTDFCYPRNATKPCSQCGNRHDPELLSRRTLSNGRVMLLCEYCEDSYPKCNRCGNYQHESYTSQVPSCQGAMRYCDGCMGQKDSWMETCEICGENHRVVPLYLNAWYTPRSIESDAGGILQLCHHSNLAIGQGAECFHVCQQCYGAASSEYGDATFPVIRIEPGQPSYREHSEWLQIIRNFLKDNRGMHIRSLQVEQTEPQLF